MSSSHTHAGGWHHITVGNLLGEGAVFLRIAVVRAGLTARTK